MKRHIDLFGVPMDLGAARRGVDMGPSALRIAGVVEKIRALGHDVADRGNVDVAEMATTAVGDGSAKYGSQILDCVTRLAAEVEKSVAAGRFPVVLGGDHSIAVGTVTGIASVHRRKNQKIGLIWFDAHGDMNTPDTSPSGNVHGMPLAMLLGHGPREFAELGGFKPKVEPRNVALMGVRSLDPWEREIVKKSGIHVITMKEIDRLGMAEATERAIEFVSDGTAGFHLSFDLDGLDPNIAPGVGTPEPGGINFREAHLLMELVADSDRLLGLELVELNAVLDDRNRTAELCAHLIQSALGRRIL